MWPTPGSKTGLPDYGGTWWKQADSLVHEWISLTQVRVRDIHGCMYQEQDSKMRKNLSDQSALTIFMLRDFGIYVSHIYVEMRHSC